MALTELLLICSIGALGVAFATTVARWLLQRPSGDEALVRAAGLVSGGVVRYLRRQNVVAIAAAGVIGAALFLAYGVAYQLEAFDGVSAREHGVWVTLSYILGAGFGLCATTVASWAARQASARVAHGARRSLDDSLQIAIRAGAVSGVVSLALALIGLAGLFLAMYLYQAGFDGDASAALAAAPNMPRPLVGFALGAAFVSLLSQLGGGIYGKVADIGADVAGKLEAADDSEMENPAAVADLVGDNVGDGAARAGGIFAAAAAELSAAMLIASLVYRHNDDLSSVTAIVLFPLVARTFSLVAVLFGVMVVRTDDTEVPMSALTRGLYVTTLLYAVGAVGCAKWLLADHWMRLGSCAVLGAVASLVLLYAVQYYSEQRYRPVRSLAEAARGGPTLLTLRGLFTATEAAAALVSISVAAALAAYHVGAGTTLEGGGLLGVAIAVGGMLGSAPYVLAMDAMGSIADTAGGIIELTVARERPDVRARARLLDAVGTTVKAFAKSLAIVTSSLACFLLIVVFILEVWGARAGGAGQPQLDVGSPSLYLGATLGLVVVLAFFWITLRRVVASGRDLVNELRVRMGSDAPEPLDSRHLDPRLAKPLDGELGIEGDGDELVCVEIVSRMALRGMLAPALVGVGLPLCIGVALRLLAPGDTVATSAEALVALLVVATIAGALGSLLFTNAGSAWDNAKKYIETGAHGGRSSSPTYVAAVIGDTIGDPLKGAIGPATQALLKTLSTLALVFLPFFI